MTAAGPGSGPETIERKIAERIAAAKLRLRFDKVALRLLDGLIASIAESVPEDQCIIFTLTAPVKHPAKTRAGLERVLRELRAGELRTVVNDNEVRARRVTTVSTNMPRMIGFVHNPDSSASLILDLAESILSER